VSDTHRNPQFQPQDEEYDYRQYDSTDYPTEIAGPGGRNTNIENNERGILDAVVFRAMSMHREASLPSSKHDPHAQGIYAEGREKYAD
jgi:hypothetical protein